MQLPSRRQILAKLEAEKQALADLKKDPISLDPDAESLARLKALKGEAERPAKAQIPVRTAQVCPRLNLHKFYSDASRSVFRHVLQHAPCFSQHATYLSINVGSMLRVSLSALSLLSQDDLADAAHPSGDQQTDASLPDALEEEAAAAVRPDQDADDCEDPSFACSLKLQHVRT